MAYCFFALLIPFKVMKHQVTIQPEDTVEVFQKKFNRIYPFLKVEFFKKPHRKGQSSEKKDMHPGTARFQDLIDIRQKITFQWNDTMTIGEFEQGIRKDLGLYVQVFRKSGKIWLLTSATDNWTLLQQNDEGQSLEQHLKHSTENPDDHDMY